MLIAMPIHANGSDSTARLAYSADSPVPVGTEGSERAQGWTT